MPLVTRTCIGCGLHDDHPKHLLGAVDGTDIAWHNDCHSRATDCPQCNAVVESAGDLKGDELRDHIVAFDPASRVSATATPEQPEGVPTTNEVEAPFETPTESES